MATSDTPPSLPGPTYRDLLMGSTSGASSNEEAEDQNLGPTPSALPGLPTQAEEAEEGFSSGDENKDQAYATNLGTNPSSLTLSSASPPVTHSQTAYSFLQNYPLAHSGENIYHSHNLPLVGLEYRNPSCTRITNSSTSRSGDNKTMYNQPDVHQNPQEVLNWYQYSTEKGHEDFCEWEMEELGIDGTTYANSQFQWAHRGLDSPIHRVSQGNYLAEYEGPNFIDGSVIENVSDYDSKVFGFSVDEAATDSGFPSPTCELG